MSKILVKNGQRKYIGNLQNRENKPCIVTLLNFHFTSNQGHQTETMMICHFMLPIIILYAGENAVRWTFMYVDSGLNWYAILGNSLMVCFNSSKNLNII